MFNEYDYDDNVFPLGYLITARSFGTWLHGDERGAVDRHGKNSYGTADIASNSKLEKLMHENMKQSPVLFNQNQRAAIEAAIGEVCRYRGYDLQAVNCRSNHFHAVISTQSKPEPIANAFKSYATRKMRELNLIDNKIRVWSRGCSRRYLWKPRHVSLAIEYVLYGQGDFDF
jgi:REP element-mobilizing transposase RayT